MEYYSMRSPDLDVTLEHGHAWTSTTSTTVVRPPQFRGWQELSVD